MKKIAQRIFIVLLLVVLAVVIGGAVWVSNPYAPDTAALAAYARADKTDDWYAYPAATTTHADTGFILYPGGLVEYRAYAVLAEALSRDGDVLVVVPRVPLHLAIIDPTVADKVVATYPAIQSWYIGGHSLGGTAAAIYADTHPDLMKGLFLWASTPPNGNSLADNSIPVVTLHGSRDTVFSTAEYTSSKPLLPATASWITIEGTNHSYFGNYGPQRGDGSPTVDKTIAQSAIVQATLMLLDK